MDSTDPEGDATFWAMVSGWRCTSVFGAPAIQHPSGRGAHVSFWPEPVATPAGVENRLHLEVPPSPGETTDTARAALRGRGATPAVASWAHGHPWTELREPSGHELCLLAAR